MVFYNLLNKNKHNQLYFIADNIKAVTLGTEYLDTNFRITVSGWGTKHDGKSEPK
jgi:hypothetical protein